MFDTPALIVVILSIEECNKLRVYCKCEFTDFIDCIARDGSECAKRDFFWFCQDTLRVIIICYNIKFIFWL